MKKVLLIIIGGFCMWHMSVSSVFALGNETFTMKEVYVGIMIKDQGKIGNGEYFNGRGGGSVDDYKIMISEHNNEFVYCIEPGVLSIDDSQYQSGNAQLLFLEAYNKKTSAQSKMNNVAKLVQLVQNNHRYDDGSVETRLHYLVIQTLIWEVMCEERNEQFTSIAPAAGTNPITYLLRATHESYLNRFNQLYEEYEDMMYKYSVIPSFMTSNIDKAPEILLDQFDYTTKEYYTVLEDSQDIVKWYQFITDDNIRIFVEGNKVRIVSSEADYSTIVSGYNTKIRGNALNPESEIVGHKQGSNQALISIAPISGERNNAFFKVRTDNFMGTLTIDPNGGIYENSSGLTKAQKLAGETFNITQPTRGGYSFNRWQLLGAGRLDGNIYTFNKGEGVLTAEWINHSPIITTPITNNESIFIDHDNLIVQLGNPFIALDHATAWDEEDGDITSRLRVIENTVPLDSQNNTTLSGQYKVVYEVQDDAGSIAQKIAYVIVNQPPIIAGTDRYFFVGDDVNTGLLLEGVRSTDKEDGELTNRVFIKENKVDSFSEGQYNVLFEVTDNYRKTIQKEIIVNVLAPRSKQSDLFLRYINKDYLGTLMAQSKWRIDNSLNQLLIDSLNKPVIDNESMYVYEWSSEDNEIFKQKILAEGQSVNLSFFNQFRVQ